MTTELAPRRLTSIGQPIALAIGLCLLLAACGGSDRPTLVESSSPLVEVTAVPTTPPLSLPPADTSLPALAPLPASVTVASEVDDTPAVSDSNTPETTEPATDTAPAPDVEAPQAATIALSGEQPPPTTVVASAQAWSDCLITAAQDAAALDLLDPIAAGTTTDLSSVQLNSLAAASASCDIATAALSSTDLDTHVASSASCLSAWLGSSGGGSVFVGLVSASWGQPTPAWAHTHFVDALDACFTGVSFAAEVMDVVSADASLSGAFDPTCLATSFDTSGVLRGYAQRLVTDPQSATLTVGLSDSWVLNCANVGQMVAAAAVAEGVSLSASTISCIDSELRSSGAVAQLVAGTADTDTIGIATIACLTSDEASALLG